MFKLICIAFFLGLAIVPSYASVAPKPKSDITCELCTLVLTAADTLISKNETDDKIISFIEKNLCGRLGSLNGTCVNFMEAEGRQVLYELAQGIHPSIICHRIGLCNAKVQKPIEHVKISSASLNCTVCKLVMTQVKNMLNNNASETQVLNFIEDHLCNLTGAFSTLCKTLITSFGPQILKLVANDVDPGKICALIQMCPPNSTVETTGSKPNQIFCELTTNVLVEHLNGQYMMSEVESLLNHACNIHGTSGACTTFVQTFVPTGLNLVSQDIKPNEVCETFDFNKPKSGVNNPITCELCTIVLTAAQSLVAKNESEEKILSFIEKELCNRLGSLNATCVNFLETEGKQILNDLASGLNASVVCKKFGLCAAPRVQENPIVCTLCQYLIQFIDSELKGNRTEAAVVNALENVCKIVPTSLRNECDSLISTYGVYLVQLLVEFADPLKVCQAIKVCD